jgi:hypothetical protein
MAKSYPLVVLLVGALEVGTGIDRDLPPTRKKK